MILFKQNDRAVFVHGFEKKDKANIRSVELVAFRRYAEIYLGYSDAEMKQRVKDGALFKVEDPEEENAK
ncbi:MAG: type II toxin-antitoxin system RelE/ParE family toxin [Terracidiphilus sp.]